MPRDCALILSDVQGPTLTIVCAPCGRRGRFNIAKLVEQHSMDAKLTDLLAVLTENCPKARHVSVYDDAGRCTRAECL
jgi:hypothetical protein